MLLEQEMESKHQLHAQLTQQNNQCADTVKQLKAGEWTMPTGCCGTYVSEGVLSHSVCQLICKQ